MLQDTQMFSKNIGSAHVDIILSSYGTEAYMKISANEKFTGSERLTKVAYEELRTWISENRIIYGVLEDSVRKLSEMPIPTESVLIAQGILPKRGRDGQIQYYKSNNSPLELISDEKEEIDFESIPWFNDVNVGDILAQKILPTQGEEGINVYGEKLPAYQGKKSAFRYGKNVGETPDGMMLMALKAGRVAYYGDSIQINEVLTIKGDVDAQTGNIRFLGDIVIEGDIKSGFDVYCAGNMEVMGVVEAANLNIGRDLVVRGGIQGNTSSMIEVGGNVICRFMENASIFARGHILTDFIVHSRVSCGASIIAKGKKGLIVGGELRTKTEVSAQRIGSYMGTKTLIEIGLDPNRRERLENYREEQLRYKERVQEIQPQIDSGKELAARGQMDHLKKMSFMKVVNDYNSTIKTLTAIEQEMKAIEQEILENKDGLVDAREGIYPGVKINIGRFSRTIKNEVGRCKLFISENDILISKV